jgi:hypothetical protein
MEERYRLRRIFSLARRCSPFEGDIKMALQIQGTTAPALVIVYCAQWVRGRLSQATGTETGRLLSVLPTLSARTITSTFTCCGAKTAAKSTGQTAPISFSASARIARAALRGSRFDSL